MTTYALTKLFFIMVSIRCQKYSVTKAIAADWFGKLA
jgi:hypothetical protein